MWDTSFSTDSELSSTGNYVQDDWKEYGENAFDVYQVAHCGIGKLEYELGYHIAKFDADCFENGYN